MYISDRFSPSQLARTWYLPLIAKLHGDVPATILAEHNSDGYICQFPERFLQALWNEQIFTTELRLVDERRLEILSPGTWNVSAGPDFRHAVIQIDGQRLQGDVEIHRTVADWHAHGHSGDPNYKNVILHVVWKAGKGNTDDLPPTFELAGVAETGWGERGLNPDQKSYPYGQMVQAGRCAEQLKALDNDQLRHLFQAAGLARFARKTQYMLEQITIQGASQALYEGVFQALGYTKNKQAFRQLARAVPLTTLEQFSSPREKTAVLWGVSGLLPDPSSVNVTPRLKDQTRHLWRLWWRSGTQQGDFCWQRGGGRPLNSPERRLAAACRWLRNCSFDPLTWLKSLLADTSPGPHLFKKLVVAIAVEDPWDHCLTFRHALKRPAGLLGMSRRRDIVMNILLPFIAAYGTHSRQPMWTELAESGWLAAPQLQGNRRLAEGIHRFLFPPSRGKVVVQSGAEQQGILEMYQSLCLYCGGDCAGCPLYSIIPVEIDGQKC